MNRDDHLMNSVNFDTDLYFLTNKQDEVTTKIQKNQKQKPRDDQQPGQAGKTHPI